MYPFVPKFLSEKELKRMITTPLPKSNLNLVRDVFLFSAFTGISFSDLRNLTVKNLAQAEDGTWWIHSARQKTGTPFHVPLLELPLELIRYSLLQLAHILVHLVIGQMGVDSGGSPVTVSHQFTHRVKRNSL